MSKFPKFALATAKLGQVDWETLKAQYMPTLVGGLAGATIGGGGMALLSSKRPEETDEEFAHRRRTQALSGALAGGLVGGAVPALGHFADKITEDVPQPPVEPSALDRGLAVADQITSTPVMATTGGIAAGAAAYPFGKSVRKSFKDEWSGLKNDIANLKVQHPNIAGAESPAFIAAATGARRAAQRSLMYRGLARGIEPAAITAGSILLPKLINKLKETAASAVPHTQ